MPPVTLDTLPQAVTRYLAAHRLHDTAAELANFTQDATVTDDGTTHSGIDAIELWMNRTAGEYSYTIEPIAVHETPDREYTVTQRLEGDFPGGVVDLHFRFTLRDGLIERLVIEG
ncbi:nuclear transport factor 2 family protein [Streptomyces sp. NPDC057950]|uniref:nuclear transport factor 2 family protein n=1 Tax=Streptomyces sp. NPDC057950 TaxID=3346288 RepID=UPI0036EB0500